MDLASGEIMALTPKDLWKLIHLLVVIAGLELVTYEQGMRRRRHRRDMAEKTWRDEATEKSRKRVVRAASKEAPVDEKPKLKEPSQVEIFEERKKKRRKDIGEQGPEAQERPSRRHKKRQ